MREKILNMLVMSCIIGSMFKFLIGADISAIYLAIIAVAIGELK